MAADILNEFSGPGVPKETDGSTLFETYRAFATPAERDPEGHTCLGRCGGSVSCSWRSTQ